jgi:hypothetical protein
MVRKKEPLVSNLLRFGIDMRELFWYIRGVYGYARLGGGVAA